MTVSNTKSVARVPEPSADVRPGVAIVANAHTPYRLHLHRRIAGEIRQIRLWSVFTHETSNAPWGFTASPEIGPLLLGAGESSVQQGDPRNSWREWRRGGRVIRELVQRRVKCVVMMGYNDAGRARVMRWCHHHKVACFLFGDSNIRGDNARGIKRLAKGLVLRLALKWCDGVLACGSLGRAYYNRYGVPNERIFYFPYEPDYELIQNLPPDAIDAARRRFSLNPQRRRIMYSGRLALPKRVDTLIDAFAAIAGRRPEWDLLIVGSGPLEADLRQRVPPVLGDRVLLTGFLDDQAVVSALYRLSDVLVLPSEFEPWALVINEAAAAGMAIVASEVVGAAAELVRPGVNGALFPAGDTTALAEALLLVTANVEPLKAGSAGVLAAWRQLGDPVEGLRQALRFAHVL